MSDGANLLQPRSTFDRLLNRNGGGGAGGGTSSRPETFLTVQKSMASRTMQT